MDFWIFVAIGAIIGCLLPVKKETPDDKSIKLISDNTTNNDE